MSTAFQVSQTWPDNGFVGIDNLVIFGDSYSSVGYSSEEPHPTAANPLGVPYPGEDLWTDVAGSDKYPQLQPNWVGALISKYVPGQKYSEHDHQRSSILVYDYAVGGDSVAGVGHQINRQFIPHAGQQPDWAPWASEDTLFVTWVGINDLAFSSDPSPLLKTLFSHQKRLYEVGARNFLLIDCPPIDRSPALAQVAAGVKNSFKSRYTDWNVALRSSIVSFVSECSDATILLYSSHETFSRVLDDPVGHGFHEADAGSKAGKGIWMDRLHPTSKMHDFVAKDLAAFLSTVVKADDATA